MADYMNNQSLELQWAMKAYDNAETYDSLIVSVDPRLLKLSLSDDEIYTKFRQEFPDFVVEKLDEEEMKTPEAKVKWRSFCEHFKTQIDEYNSGCLIRSDCRKPFSQDNSIFVVRIQFLAIEIARNREGFHDEVRKIYKAAKS